MHAAPSAQWHPSGEQTGEEALRALGKHFKLQSNVVDHLIKAQIEDLEELRFFWDTEEKIEPWVLKIGIADETARNIQLARLRRAWSAVRLWYQQAEQDRSKVATADLDTLLQDSELRDFKTLFWVRYRLKFPPEIHPADATLSRVSREMSKRMLCVFSVWKVRSLQYQLHTTNKKRKLADGLFTEAEDNESVAQDWEGYLDKLHTLMIAYSMAGVSAVQGAPAAGGEATLGADSVKFVQAPLDVMLAYFYRAKRTTSLLPVAKRLPWLMMRDAEERAEWVARFRESSSTLGQVVKDVFVARDAHWIPSLQPSGQQAGGAAPMETVKPATTANQFQLGKPINGKSVAKVLKDGSKLCQSFQHGQCKNKPPCPLGQHRCGLVVKKERVCGASGHGAAACKNTSKAI